VRQAGVWPWRTSYSTSGVALELLEALTRYRSSSSAGQPNVLFACLSASRPHPLRMSTRWKVLWLGVREQTRRRPDWVHAHSVSRHSICSHCGALRHQFRRYVEQCPPNGRPTANVSLRNIRPSHQRCAEGAARSETTALGSPPQQRAVLEQCAPRTSCLLSSSSLCSSDKVQTNSAIDAGDSRNGGPQAVRASFERENRKAGATQVCIL